MHSYELLEILAAGLFLALLFGYIAKKLGLSSIVGYLIAGFIVGPYSPGFVADPELAAELAEAGVVLMMFGVGLHFNLKDLMAVKGVAVPGAIIQSTISAACGIAIAFAFGMSHSQGAILGLGLAVASTVVLLRVLTDNGHLNTIHGHVAVGWLIVEDILTVLILVLLPSLAVIMNGDSSGGFGKIALALGKAGLHLVVLWIVVMIIGGKVVPWVFVKISRTRSSELFTLISVVAAFGTAVAAAVVFNTSMALGAFLGGMVVGQSTAHHQANAAIMPLKDVFSVLFFLSVGMLFSPEFLVTNWKIVLGCLAVVLLIKPLAATFAVIILGYSVKTAVTVAVALAQVGEFSFILAQQAMQYKMIDNNVYMILVVCAIVSITLNPGFFKQVPRIERFLQKHEKLWAVLNARAERRVNKSHVNRSVKIDGETDRTHAIVVGYGPTGQAVTKALIEKNITPVIIDMNIDTVNQLNKQKMYAVFGDSTNREVLEAAGIYKAEYFIVTVYDMEVTSGTVAAVRNLDCDIKILVRVRFIKEAQTMLKLGANEVAEEESEVAKALAALVTDRIPVH